MLRENSKIKVHILNGAKEIATTNSGKVFTVKKHGEKLGIDWNTKQSPYTCRGEIFTPFETFASNVIFEDVENKQFYFYDNITSVLQNRSINHICFNCQKLFNGCNGTTNKVYTGCIFRTTI